MTLHASVRTERALGSLITMRTLLISVAIVRSESDVSKRWTFYHVVQRVTDYAVRDGKTLQLMRILRPRQYASQETDAYD